jgi:hypothetical protein
MDAFTLLCQAGERFVSHLCRGRQQGSESVTSSEDSRRAADATSTRCEVPETRFASNSEERDSRNERDQVSESSEEELTPLLASRAGEIREADGGGLQI